MRRRTLVAKGLGLGLGALASTSFAKEDAEDYADPDRMYDALSTLPRMQLTLRGGVIDLVFAPDVPSAQRPAIVDWVQRSAAALVQYFGEFSVRRVGLLVVPDEGVRVGHGTAYGYAGSAIRVTVGRDAGAVAFETDWVLVHEMVHLAFPTVPRRHLWIEEGSATYVEPIARVQAGQLNAAWVWQQMRRSLPQGLPQPGDEGLDRTHTWGRTYWGGALFCLLADMALLRRTELRFGLQEALGAIRRASGGNSARWSIEQTLQVADAAAGAPVLSELYRDMAQQPVATDLDTLFAQLGVQAGPAFDETAPLAPIRQAIMRAREFRAPV